MLSLQQMALGQSPGIDQGEKATPKILHRGEPVLSGLLDLLDRLLAGACRLVQLPPPEQRLEARHHGQESVLVELCFHSARDVAPKGYSRFPGMPQRIQQQ